MAVIKLLARDQRPVDPHLVLGPTARPAAVIVQSCPSMRITVRVEVPVSLRVGVSIGVRLDENTQSWPVKVNASMASQSRGRGHGSTPEPYIMIKRYNSNSPAHFKLGGQTAPTAVRVRPPNSASMRRHHYRVPS